MDEKWWKDCPKEQKKMVREWCKYETANIRMLFRREITVNRYIFIRRILEGWLDRIENYEPQNIRDI